MELLKIRSKVTRASLLILAVFLFWVLILGFLNLRFGEVLSDPDAISLWNESLHAFYSNLNFFDTFVITERPLLLAHVFSFFGKLGAHTPTHQILVNTLYSSIILTIGVFSLTKILTFYEYASPLLASFSAWTIPIFISLGASPTSELSAYSFSILSLSFFYIRRSDQLTSIKEIVSILFCGFFTFLALWYRFDVVVLFYMPFLIVLVADKSLTRTINSDDWWKIFANLAVLFLFAFLMKDKLVDWFFDHKSDLQTLGLVLKKNYFELFQIQFQYFVAVQIVLLFCLGFGLFKKSFNTTKMKTFRFLWYFLGSTLPPLTIIYLFDFKTPYRFIPFSFIFSASIILLAMQVTPLLLYRILLIAVIATQVLISINPQSKSLHSLLLESQIYKIRPTISLQIEVTKEILNSLHDRNIKSERFGLINLPLHFPHGVPTEPIYFCLLDTIYCNGTKYTDLTIFSDSKFELRKNIESNLIEFLIVGPYFKEFKSDEYHFQEYCKLIDEVYYTNKFSYDIENAPFSYRVFSCSN